MAAPGVALGDVDMALPAQLLDYQSAHQLGRRTRDEINDMADCLEGGTGPGESAEDPLVADALPGVAHGGSGDCRSSCRPS